MDSCVVIAISHLVIYVMIRVVSLLYSPISKDKIRVQRLVYSPKAFIFIRRRNGDIADVTRYCTAGEVNRRVNAVSTAKFTLRNPNMLFTAKGGGHAAFFPMDPVTIYLQRLKGRPVRVFTGFLDETPYYELYPGVIEFRASCTLKKLLYTYFDPALPYTSSFLAQYGWQPTGDGGIYNPRAINGIENDKDGGMGALLYATMTEIGHWNKNNIKIEALPQDLITRMANMLKDFEDENAAAQQEVETLIGRFIGAGDYGGSGGTTSGDNTDVSKYEGTVAQIIYQVGKAMNVRPKYMLAAFETGIVESGMKNLNYGDSDSKGWRQERTSIYGDGPDGATNVNASAKRFFQECAKFDTGDGQTAGELAADVQRPAAQYRGRYEAVRAQAVTLMEKTKEAVDNKNSKNSSSSTPDRTVRAGSSSKSGSSSPDVNHDQLAKSTDVHGAMAGLQVIANLAAAFGLQVTAGKDDHSTYTSTGNVSDHSRGWAIDVSNGVLTQQEDDFCAWVKRNLAPMIKQLIWRDTDQFNGYTITGHQNHVHVAIKPEYAGNKEKTLTAVLNALAGRPIGAPGQVPLGKKSVVVMVDSLSVDTYPYLKAAMDDGVIVFDGQVGRNSADTLTKLQSLMTNKVKVVVFDAGTNDDFSQPDAYRDRLDQVKEAAGKAHVVVYTLNRGNVPDSQVKAMNDRVRDFGNSGNVSVVDWGSKDALLGPDGIHPGIDGYKTRASMTSAVVQPTVTVQSDTSSNSSTDNSQIMSRVNATVLAAQMQWASVEDRLEAVALQGNKSLMNDKPLMPFIQQMAESSLRQFQSMPNGDFFAFYPDYFGETWHRPPYWIIDDIEVLDGRVKLSDDALVTHEYAIGDTFYQGAGSFMSKIFSAGAVSITNAFQSGSVTTDANKKAQSKDKDTRKLFHAFNRAMTQDEAVQFLTRYGARPDVQEFPFIRNPFYEMFMAYQRFMQAWSRQFLSPFKLTFMPELYPGGKVGFIEHGLQMYIEEVTHTWDYGSGFVTEADLSSPAAMLDNKGQPLNDNLPSNMPTALLEVANDNTPTNSPGIPQGSTVAPDGNGGMRPT